MVKPKLNKYQIIYSICLIILLIGFVGYFLWTLITRRRVDFYEYGIRVFFLIILLLISGAFFYLLDNIFLNYYYLKVSKKNRKLKTADILALVGIHLGVLGMLFLYANICLWNFWIALIIIVLSLITFLLLSWKKPNIFIK
jgi:hypothetical protein